MLANVLTAHNVVAQQLDNWQWTSKVRSYVQLSRRQVTTARQGLRKATVAASSDFAEAMPWYWQVAAALGVVSDNAQAAHATDLA